MRASSSSSSDRSGPTMSNRPKGLPPVDESKKVRVEANALDISRFCTTCGKEARVVANNSGTHCNCISCKKWWPISSTPKAQEIPLARGRSLRKETYVEPDWSKAFDNIDGDLTHEQVGPRRK